MLTPLLDRIRRGAADSVHSATGRRSRDVDWREVAEIVLKIDPEKEPERAYRAWESHLARARWMTTNGYKYLFAGGAPHLSGPALHACEESG